MPPLRFVMLQGKLKVHHRCKDFYEVFHTMAENFASKCGARFEKYEQKFNELYSYLVDRSDYIQSHFNIDITLYKDWKDKIHRGQSSIYNIFERYRENGMEFTNEENDIKVILMAFDDVVVCMRKRITRLNNINRASALTYSQYRSIVHKYYKRVCKYLVLGYGYRFQNTKLGLLYIIRTVRDTSKDTYSTVDWNATKERKKQLIKEGKITPDGKSLPGVTCSIVRKNPVSYLLDIRDTDIMRSPKRKLRYNCTIPSKFRVGSYQKILDTFCKTDEDIFNLDVSLYYMMKLYLLKNPDKYTNYVRTPDQRNPFRRKDYWKIRK